MAAGGIDRVVATFVLVPGSFCNSGVWARVVGDRIVDILDALPTS